MKLHSGNSISAGKNAARHPHSAAFLTLIFGKTRLQNQFNHSISNVSKFFSSRSYDFNRTFIKTMFFSVMRKIFQILIGFLHTLTFSWFTTVDKAGKAPVKKLQLSFCIFSHMSQTSLWYLPPSNFVFVCFTETIGTDFELNEMEYSGSTVSSCGWKRCSYWTKSSGSTGYGAMFTSA